MKLQPVRPGKKLQLRDRDARAPHAVDADHAAVDREMDELGARLSDLQTALYAEKRQALLVVFQARDAGGKDSTIRAVFTSVNPQGCSVHTFGPPSELELAHDFLWRVHQRVPPLGMIGVFNRSHYEDVLVARVRELVPKSAWKRRYREINDFERLLAGSGVTIAKFFLHISRAEQKQRLRDRLEDATKNWKFRAGDLDDRAAWREYTRAYEDALRKCSTKWAPWYVVPADRKRARNLLVMRTLVETLEEMDPKYPRADPKVLSYLRKIR